MKKLFDYFPVIKAEKILEAIQAKDLLLKKNSSAVWDATNLNFMESSCRILEDVSKEYRGLQPWLDKGKRLFHYLNFVEEYKSKIQKHMTSDEKLNELCKKIKVVSITSKNIELSECFSISTLTSKV